MSFIVDYPYKLSLLDVNCIVNAVLKNHKMDVDYDSLLNLNNDNKKLIAVLIAKHRRAIELKDRIKSMINSSDSVLNYELWTTYILLETDEMGFVEFVISKFWQQPEKIKLAILSKNIKPDIVQYKDLLFQILNSDDSLAVIVKSMYCLHDFDSSYVKQFSNTKDEKILKAYNELLCVKYNLKYGKYPLLFS